MGSHKKKKLCSVEEVAELRRDGMKIKDIAEKLDVGKTTVDVNIKKAKQQGLLPEVAPKEENVKEYKSYGKAKAEEYIKKQPKINVDGYEKKGKEEMTEVKRTYLQKMDNILTQLEGEVNIEECEFVEDVIQLLLKILEKGVKEEIGKIGVKK